ncbi:MAG TPA: sigma-54 dependent transcriptional regulator [Longimicrobiales bacterium]|nr:sigma-54 dependent transcriptional regulator [Longimicrobiales bacterium]
MSDTASIDEPGPLLGTSGAMAGVRTFLERAAAVDAPVLLVGESGTGKSHLARLLHRRGPRAAGPFVSVNCAGIPDGLFESEFFGHRKGAFTGATESRPGLFEQASGGSLFLDEIGELPGHQQAKLLAVLEEGRVRRVGDTRVRPVDVRTVAATCRDLEAALAAGSFRTDLYHRLALLRCEIPPLRRRKTDLPGLADHFLASLGRRHGVQDARLTSGARALLQAHPWPGNVRELAHVLEAALILAGGPVLDRDHLATVMRGDGAGWGSGAFDGEGTSGRRRDAVHRGPTPSKGDGGARRSGRYSFYGSPEEERELIRTTLARHRGNRTRTARALGMSRNTLRARMRKYDI